LWITPKGRVMRELQEPDDLRHEQYGLAGWLVLALIVLTETALLVASVTAGGGAHDAARGGVASSAALACTVSPEASGAMHRIEFFDDPMCQLFHACQ
jgi:hypothetical protein